MDFEQVTAYLEEKFGVVLDWTSETALPMLKELMHRITMYNTIKYGIGTLVCGIALIVAIIFFTKEIKAYMDEKNSWFIDYVDPICNSLTLPALIFTVIIGFATIFSLPFFFYNMSRFINWICIPEVQLFEYIKGNPWGEVSGTLPALAKEWNIKSLVKS